LLVFAYGNILTTGEPFVVYGTLNEGYSKFFESSPLSLIAFEETDFENAIQYSKYLLPYIFVGAFNSIDNNFENILGEHWIGLIPLIIFGLILIYSYKSKNKKLEVFVITLFILGIIWIYGSITSEELGELGVPGRYVLPAFVLSSMLFGYAIEQIFSKIRNKKGIKIKIFQLIFLSSLFVIIIISYNFSPAITIFDQENYLKNPFDYEREFPLNDEKILEDSIIVTPVGARSQEYNLASFRIITINHTSINSINLLQDIIKEKDNVYVFKIPFNNGEKNMIQNLIDNHGFVLEELSETFCKMKLKSGQKSISDEKCLNNDPIRKFNQK